MMAESGGWRIKLVNVDNCPCGHRVGYEVWGHRSRLKHYLQPGDEVELLDGDDVHEHPVNRALGGQTMTVETWGAERGLVSKGLLALSDEEYWPLSCVRPVKK
jgi:hypothetical protein